MNKGLKNILMIGIGGLLAILVLLFIVAAAVGYGSASGAIAPRQSALVLMAGFALVLMIGSFWIGVLWMRSIDEAAREAHKWAWYWGGTAGMTVGGVFMLLSAVPRQTPVPFPMIVSSTPDPAGYAASGAFSLMLLMTLGYTIAWAIWWWRHR